MNLLPPHDTCCGCGACAQACPHAAITMAPDAEGFEQPQCDEARCTGCRRCATVCPVLHPLPPAPPLAAMGAINTDDGVRRRSASGGTFHALASGVLARGGIVVAAAMDGDFAVRHRAVGQPADLPPLCGSKYVQSHMGDAFRCVRAALRSGREVLFVGTPCQVAALRRFLGREEPLLLAADFFCHGVPSPALWQRCLDEMLRRIGIGRSDVAAIAFRDKSRGWRRYHTASSSLAATTPTSGPSTRTSPCGRRATTAPHAPGEATATSPWPTSGTWHACAPTWTTTAA